ncbi:heterokaryon incompatibility, partial [Aaosphaeria arxii CBS 175.79]
YDALSYCWGGSTATCHLQCNGKDLRIMQNLQQALLNLRRSDSTLRWLWVDAICINQADDDEKAMQIPNMMYIYQQASHVIAWLGTDVHHLRVLQ